MPRQVQPGGSGAACHGLLDRAVGQRHTSDVHPRVHAWPTAWRAGPRPGRWWPRRALRRPVPRGSAGRGRLGVGMDQEVLICDGGGRARRGVESRSAWVTPPAWPTGRLGDRPPGRRAHGRPRAWPGGPPPLGDGQLLGQRPVQLDPGGQVQRAPSDTSQSGSWSAVPNQSLSIINHGLPPRPGPPGTRTRPPARARRPQRPGRQPRPSAHSSGAVSRGPAPAGGPRPSPSPRPRRY